MDRKRVARVTVHLFIGLIRLLFTSTILPSDSHTHIHTLHIFQFGET